MLSRRVGWNVALNGILTLGFVLANQWALRAQFEETFVALALCYGCIVIVGNALYVSADKGA